MEKRPPDCGKPQKTGQRRAAVRGVCYAMGRDCGSPEEPGAVAHFSPSQIPESVSSFEGLAVWCFEQLQRIAVGKPVPLGVNSRMLPVFSAAVIEADDGRTYCRLEGFPAVDREGLNAPFSKSWMHARSAVGPTPLVEESAPPPPPPDVVPVPLADLIYSQHSVYGANVAATVENMQDGNNETGTGTGAGGPSGPTGPTHVTFDMGAVLEVDRVIISATGPGFPGGWGGGYVSGGLIQTSEDGQTWDEIGEPVTIGQYEQVVVQVSFSARFVRYGFPYNNAYLALGEFFALAPGQEMP